MNNLWCSSKPLIVFSEITPPSGPSHHGGTASTEPSGPRSGCAWHFPESKLSLCILKISLAVSQGTAHPVCPLPRLGISRVAPGRLSLLLWKASAENYFLSGCRYPDALGLAQPPCALFRNLPSHLCFSPCIMVSG